MEKCAFEINCILAQPEQEESLSKLSKATARYSRLSSHMQVLNQLETQTQQAQEQQPPNES
jgi:hypothetical protein